MTRPGRNASIVDHKLVQSTSNAKSSVQRIDCDRNCFSCSRRNAVGLKCRLLTDLDSPTNSPLSLIFAFSNRTGKVYSMRQSFRVLPALIAGSLLVLLPLTRAVADDSDDQTQPKTEQSQAKAADSPAKAADAPAKKDARDSGV